VLSGLVETQKATKPLLTAEHRFSRFSIEAALDPKVDVKLSEEFLIAEKEVPTNHFSQSDIDSNWSAFLEKLKSRDSLIYNAIAGFRLVKSGEDTVLVHHASQTARAEFERIQADFFGPFKKVVNHHKIKVEFKMDKKLKKEIITKRSLFESMANENPVLRELDEYFKLDLT